MKILLAATGAKIQTLISVLAPPPSHRLRSYSNATDAILSICRATERNDPYQVIVLDLEMDDCLDIARFVQRLNMDMQLRTELIFLSEREDLELRLDAASFGAAAYLVWPNRAAQLPQLINTLEGAP